MCFNENIISLEDSFNKLMKQSEQNSKDIEKEYFILASKYSEETISNILKITNCSMFEVEDYINTLNNINVCYNYDFDKLMESFYIDRPFDNVAQLKSQLKHCKNPLQRLNIERKLNELYRKGER